MSDVDDARPTTPTATPTASPAAGTAARRARKAAQDEQAARESARRRAARAEGVPPPLTRERQRQLDPDRLAALEEERDFLLRSLDDLEHEHDAGDVDDADYAALADDYTVRAAAVLRAIEQREELMVAVRDPRRTDRAWVVSGVVVLLAIVLGVFVAQSSGRRAPGEALSGDIRQSSRDQLLEARGLFTEGKFPDAIKVYDKVLAQNPNDVEALTYRGWMLYNVARQTNDAEEVSVLLGGARSSLDHAIAVDAAYPDARVFRAIVLRDLDRPQEALADLAQLQPGSVPEAMTGLVDQLRDELTTTVTHGTAPGTTPTTAAAR